MFYFLGEQVNKQENKVFVDHFYLITLSLGAREVLGGGGGGGGGVLEALQKKLVMDHLGTLSVN